MNVNTLETIDLHNDELEEKRDTKVEQLGSNVQIRDVDVRFKFGQFFSAFFWHLTFLTVLGPLTFILKTIFDRNLVQFRNYGFIPSADLIVIYVIQVIVSSLFLIPLILLIHLKVSNGYTWMECHKNGLDLVAILFVFLQSIIRAVMVSMKYGTISEKVYTQH